VVEASFLASFLGGLLSLLSPCSALLLPAFFAYAFQSRGVLVGRTAVFYLGLCATLVPLGMGISAVGSLVYWQWDPIWAFVFSPVGGFVTKILFTTKAVKVAVGAGVAVAAGVVAVRKKLRRGTPEPEPRFAPPVFGPPEEPPPVLTPAGTATATTTEPATVPAARPI